MRKYWALFMAMMISAGLLTGCGTSAQQREQQTALRAEGMSLAASGDYEAAIDAYDEALSLADMHAGSLELDIAAYKAAALYRSGELTEAIELCSAILDLKKSAEIYLTRGLLYREAGDQEAANADFTAAMDMTSKKDLVMLGRLSYYMEDYSSAKSYLEEATADGDPEGIYWQAELYWEMGNKDYALTLYQSYLTTDEAEHPDAYAKVASYQTEQEQYEEALATIEAGIALGDSDVLQQLLAMRIAVYEYQSDWETAKSLMESYLESYPDNEDALREYEFLRTR